MVMRDMDIAEDIHTAVGIAAVLAGVVEEEKREAMEAGEMFLNELLCIVASWSSLALKNISSDDASAESSKTNPTSPVYDNSEQQTRHNVFKNLGQNHLHPISTTQKHHRR